MGFLLRMFRVAILSIFIVGCATSPKGPLLLQEQLEHPSTITLPIIENEAGLLLVKAELPGGIQGRFIVDTGATLTSIYPKLQKRLGLSLMERTSIRIHGMIATRLRPLTKLQGLTLDGQVLPEMQIVIIPEEYTSESTKTKF